VEQIKHYKIIEKIGFGGMGEVFHAFDTQLERDVAIKILHKAISENKQNAQRLVREARAAAKLVHPNVVTIYEVGQDDFGRYIVMEYVKGTSFSELIKNEGPLSVERSIDITVQVLKALALAHKMGITHRDIKPDNVLITENNEAKVLDFGIAKMEQKAGLTMAGEVLGTIEFMAPEQMLGEEINYTSDIYSTGIMLFMALTKELPLSGQNPVELLFKKLNEEPVAPSYYNKKVNSQLDQIVLKALRHNKDERWKSADEMIESLQSYLNSQLAPVPNTNNNHYFFEELQHSQDGDPAKLIKPVFIGRENELKSLVNGFHQVGIDKGQTFIIAGEAGVGKSTLTQQFRNYISHQNAWLLYGTCLYQEGMDAYLPYIDALRGFFHSDNPKFTEEQRVELKEIIKEKIPILSEFTERFSTTFFTTSWNVNEKKEEDSRNMLEGLYLLFSILSEIRPLVIIIDDLQWADEASLRLFHYLSRQIKNNKIMLIGITRTDYYDLQENGKAKLIVETQTRMRREGIVKEINLNRLTKDNCDALLEKSLQNTAFSENFYMGMFQETKGNPFFIIETLKLFHEKGEIYDDNGIWIDKKIDFKSEVPNRVEDVFMRRLSGLNEEDRELLQLSSVVGYKFDPSLLAQILEIKKLDLLKRLQKIERDFQIIISLDRHFQFEHPMLADLLYNEIPQALSKEYHLLIADELEKIHSNNFGALVGNAAVHFRKGGNHVKAVPLLFQAAIRAFDLSAFRESNLYFEDLFDSLNLSEMELPAEIPKTDLYLKSGICYEETDNWKKSLKTYKKLAEISDEQNNPQKKVDAFIRMGRVHDKLGEWDIAVKYYQNCIDLAKAHSLKNVYSRVYNKIGVYHFHTGNFDEALKYFRKTIRMADSEHGEYDKAHAYTNVGIIANIIRGEYGVALENFEKALKIYKDKGLEQYEARVHHNIGMFYSDHSEWLESIKAYEKCLQLAVDDDSKHLRALTYLNMGKAYSRQNKLVKAKKLAEKALMLFKRMADIISIAEVYHVFGNIYGAQNNFSKAEKYLKDAINIFKNKDFNEGLAQTYETYGSLCHEHGYTEKATENFLNALELFKTLKMDSKVKNITELLESVECEVVEQQ